MENRSRITLAACTLLSVAAGSAHALPPATLTTLYYSFHDGAQSIPGVGGINNPFNFSSGSSVGGNGFMGMSINNSGVSSVLVNVFASPGFNRAVLNSSTGLNAFLWAGAEAMDGDPGTVTVPSTDYVYNDGYWTSINSNGDIALSMGLRASSFANVPPSPLTGVYFNKSALPVQAGDMVTAAGVAPGTIFANFNASGMVSINDHNVVMIAGPIVESGVAKNAIIKVALNGSGGLVGETLVAKEGGPVGAGPATWTVISVAPTTCAMNNNGAVLFSGITSTGVNGISLSNQQFVATQGGAAPSSNIWASLYGAPLDLSNTGQYAFRGPLQGTPTWTESGDAGEGMSNANGGGTTLTAQTTIGGGSLNQINGSLSNDQDVDLYVITVDGGPTNIPFSATTVPDAGSGFSGANFDTVLYLFKYVPNMNSNTRTGLGRCDDAAPGVMQSTLTTASLASTHTPGTKYILGISTPKARAWSSGLYGGGTPTQDMWMIEPSQIAVGSTIVGGGMVYWTDPSNGQIARSSLTSATVLSPLTVTTPPAQSSELQSVDPGSTLLGDAIAVYDAGADSKVYFLQHSYARDSIRRCNPDGTVLEDVINFASPAPTAYATQAMAVDSVNGALYWSTQFGSINKSDLAGGSNASIFTASGTDSISAIAIDTKPISNVTGTGRIYFYDATAGAIQRTDLTGATLQSVASVSDLRSMTIDPVGRRLYYTSTAGNAIHAINLDSIHATVPDLAAPTAPVGIAFDPGAGNVYWSTPQARKLQRSSVSTPSMQDWTALGADIGERPAYGSGAFNGFAGFVRNGTAGSISLPYSIKLTGAKFTISSAMICRNGTINVDGGVSGTSPGGPTSPIRVSNRGVVAWSGNGVYVDRTQVVSSAPLTIGSLVVGQVNISSPQSMAASPNCQHLLVQTFNGSQTSGGNALVQVDFASVPGCQADFNGDGVITVSDIFNFLTAWFAHAPPADYNGDGTINVTDIFNFLTGWFAGCS